MAPTIDTESRKNTSPIPNLKVKPRLHSFKALTVSIDLKDPKKYIKVDNKKLYRN